jgi:Tfp pilus assembly protein PilF
MPVVPTDRQRIATIATAALIVLATVSAYTPALRGEFIWDDNQYVRDNVALRSPQGLWDIWADPMATPQYHPLVFSSFWVEYHLWGLSPLGYHLDNVALHAANALLLWSVMAELGVPGGSLAAAIFALHPVHLESVAWISERKNTLSGLFCLATIVVWLRFIERRDRRRYAIVLALYACTLLSKSVLCTLPVTLLLLACWRRPSDWRREIGALAPFVVMSLAIGWLGWWRERLYGNPPLPLSLFERLLIVNRALWFYVGKLLWPTGLTPIYPRWELHPTLWSYAALGLTVGALTLLWWRRRRMGNGPLVATAFFVTMLAPVLGVVDFNYTQYSFVADHFQYVASAGLIAALAGVVTIGLQRCGAARRGAVGRSAVGRAIGSISIGLWVLALGALSWRSAANYATAETFWRDTLAKNPQAWKAHSNLAGVLAREGKLDDAITHYAAALQIRPDFAEAHNHWGIVLSMQGKPDAALQQFDTALQLNPAQADAHNNAGTVLAQQGKWEDAVVHFAAAVRINPAYFEAYDSWGIVALKQGRVDEAVAHFQAALQIKPDYAPARQHLERARSLLANGS